MILVVSFSPWERPWYTLRRGWVTPSPCGPIHEEKSLYCFRRQPLDFPGQSLHCLRGHPDLD